MLVPLKPVHVRTDEHIRAHVFICIMGLLFHRYLQCKLRSAGLNYTAKTLVDLLDNIRLTLVLTDKNRKGKFLIERMSPEEAGVFSTLGLGQHSSV